MRWSHWITKFDNLGCHFHLAGSPYFTALASCIYNLKPNWKIRHCLLVPMVKFTAFSFRLPVNTKKFQLLPFPCCVEGPDSYCYCLKYFFARLVMQRWGWKLGMWDRYFIILLFYNYLLVLKLEGSRKACRTCSHVDWRWIGLFVTIHNMPVT